MRVIQHCNRFLKRLWNLLAWTVSSVGWTRPGVTQAGCEVGSAVSRTLDWNDLPIFLRVVCMLPFWGGGKRAAREGKGGVRLER